jgi:hypothetical protein
MPHFKRMHEMTVDHVHEEIQLLAIAGSTMLFETMGLMPAWKDWYTAHDQTPFYEELRTILQVLQWQRGGTRWVLKSPQHMEQIQPLLTVFPDATFVFTHRDPVSVMASNATMLTYAARSSHDVIDPHAYGTYWSDRIEEMLNAGMRDHGRFPAGQMIDVAFTDFMADEAATVERIYAVADQPFTDTTRAAMDTFVADNPRGRHGGLIYDLEGDFGVDAAARRAAMRPYTDRFDITLEWDV